MKKILLYDRKSKKVTEEKTYFKSALEFLYGRSFISKILLKIISKYSFFSKLYGFLNSLKSSKKKIVPFIKNFQIDENEFLEGVTNDYKRYHNYILAEKERERKQLEMLIGYLDKVLQEAGLSAEMANRARFQQNQILGEMDKIKDELDRITANPQYNTSNIQHI